MRKASECRELGKPPSLQRRVGYFWLMFVYISGDTETDDALVVIIALSYFSGKVLKFESFLDNKKYRFRSTSKSNLFQVSFLCNARFSLLNRSTS